MMEKKYSNYSKIKISIIFFNYSIELYICLVTNNFINII